MVKDCKPAFTRLTSKQDTGGHWVHELEKVQPNMNECQHKLHQHTFGDILAESGVWGARSRDFA
eukprot:scaffold219954_cov18-Tisochrysis_lutea.AAC.1